MKLRYSDLIIEVTRRCNQVCQDYCMRGLQQNIDVSFHDIDLFLDLNRNHYEQAYLLFFTGGEPTLNPAAIYYSIDKIINERLPIYSVGLYTNGLIYSDSVVKDFCRYNDYFHQFVLPNYLQAKPKTYSEQVVNSFFHCGSFITFSNDQYHQKISQDILQLYAKNAKGISLDYTGDRRSSDLLFSGLSKNGRCLDLRENNIRVFGNLVQDSIYLTAKGNLSCYGDGSYEFLDNVSQDFPVSKYTLEEFCYANLSLSFRNCFDSCVKKTKIFRKK